MKTSETISKFSTAFTKAQNLMGSAKKGSDNPFFRSKYADLAAVLEAVKEPLNSSGISILQPVSFENGFHHVTTMLLHESGEFISETMKLEITKNDMQALGSAISYARRYSLQSITGLPAEDDDGEKSMQRAVPKSVATAPAKVPTPSGIDLKLVSPTDTIISVEQSQQPPARSSFRNKQPVKASGEEW